MAYGALGDIVDLGDGRYQITTTNRSALEPMATAQDYVDFARGKGRNFFEFNPNKSFMFAPQDDLPEKPEGMDLDPPSGGPTPEQLAAGAGSVVGGAAGNIGAAAAASGAFSGVNLLAGVPFASSFALEDGTSVPLKINGKNVYIDNITKKQTLNLVDKKGHLNQNAKGEPSALQTAGTNLATARNTVRMGGFTGEGKPNIFKNFPAKDGQSSYFGRVGNRLNIFGEEGSAGNIGLQTAAYAGGANALTQMALGVKPKKAIESAFKTEAVRLGVTALTNSSMIGNVAALVAKPILKGAKKFLGHFGIKF